MAETFLTLLEKEKPDILSLLPPWLTPDRWWAMAVMVAKSRELQGIAQRNPMSLIAALKKTCDWGLELDGEEAIIIPYGDEAVPQAMYRGLIRRAVEAGAIANAVADIVKEGDELEVISGTDGRRLIHRPKFNLKGGKRPIVGAYALITLPNGTVDYELMDMDDIDRVKRAAERMAKRRKADAGLSPAWREFEGEMVKKSVIRRALKRYRGKRDTEAGRRYASMVAADTRFDAETTGEVQPPDNLLADAPEPEPSSPATVVVMDNEPTREAVHADATLSEQQQIRILSLRKRQGVSWDDFNNRLLELGAIINGEPDVSAVRQDQIAQLEKEMGA